MATISYLSGSICEAIREKTVITSDLELDYRKEYLQKWEEDTSGKITLSFLMNITDNIKVNLDNIIQKSPSINITIEGNVYTISKDIITIGFHNICDIILDRSYGSSRIHVIIICSKSNWIVIDLTSINGTYTLKSSNRLELNSIPNKRRILTFERNKPFKLRIATAIMEFNEIDSVSLNSSFVPIPSVDISKTSDKDSLSTRVYRITSPSIRIREQSSIPPDITTRIV